jgi:glycosyltransferase involved in cell wall biosynthesis
MDIQEEYWPSFFSKQDLESRRISHKGSIMMAEHTITISEYTKRTIVDKYKINPKKISAIHLGYDEALFKKNPAKLTYSLPQKYFFYPAASWPHKNHLRLLEAFAKVVESYPDFHLVLSGIKMQQDSAIQDKIKALKLDDRVHSLGFVPKEQFPMIYKNAYSLVFPSLFEGFGIPLLEAMASSCPIIASSATSIPEVAADAALYFDPLKPQDMAEKMVDLIAHRQLRDQLIKKGLVRIKQFSEKKMALETLEVYRKVATND